MLRSISPWLKLGLILFAACSRPAPAPAPRDPAAQDAVDRSSVRADLAAHRARQVARLGEYAARGEFPHNYAGPASAHIFRDDAGRLCAVANLVHQDGRDDLVDATVRAHNDLAIADVGGGPMLDWVLESGLTQEELARIQLPAPPLTHEQVRPARVDLVARNGADDARVNDERMKQMVVEHIAQVQAELRENTEKSLDAATERFVAMHALGGLGV
jgi:hypothetical protein